MINVRFFRYCSSIIVCVIQPKFGPVLAHNGNTHHLCCSNPPLCVLIPSQYSQVLLSFTLLPIQVDSPRLWGFAHSSWNCKNRYILFVWLICYWWSTSYCVCCVLLFPYFRSLYGERGNFTIPKILSQEFRVHDMQLFAFILSPTLFFPF